MNPIQSMSNGALSLIPTKSADFWQLLQRVVGVECGGTESKYIYCSFWTKNTATSTAKKKILVGTSVPNIVYNFIGQNHLRMEVAPWTYMSDWEKSIQELFQLILYLI